MRIIVVDDDATNRLVVRFLMELKGFGVIEADSGADALRQLAQEQVDAVLMDLQMPEVDGYEATRLLRRNGLGAGVPVFALTARTTDEARQRCMECGMNGFIRKPFEAGTAEVIRSILDQGAARSAGAAGWLLG